MKPKVSILLSVYKPNENYLMKQLQSINNQTYENIEVIVNDDCPSEKCSIDLFDKFLTRFPYKILPYDNTNLGYVKSFEKLSREADGEFIAFCDQDDIWREDKIEKSIEQFYKLADILVVVSDRKLIDENDDVICESVKSQDLNNSDNYKLEDVCKRNFFTTYVPGMCIVAKNDFIQSILPYSTYTGHDKWIVAHASVNNKIVYINDTLAYYRRHGNNVSGILIGINTKEDYLKQRVIPHINLINQFLEYYPDYTYKKEILGFAYARLNHNILKLYKYRSLAPNIAKFDILISILPNFIFRYFLKIVRRK